eukprot:238069-Prymnesium_polylepis.1
MQASRIALLVASSLPHATALPESLSVDTAPLFDAIDKLRQENERRIDELIEQHACKHVYLDVGT